MSRVSKEAVIEAISDELDRIDHVPQWVFERLEKRIKQLPSALGTNLAEVGKDCISRQQAIDALGELPTFTQDWSYNTWMYTDDVYNAIKELPPIQPKRGRWIKLDMHR